MLDMRRLRVLHAIAAHGTVSAAARALGYTAPALSQQLAALERDVGLTLTERKGRGIALTSAADMLVGHTEVLLTQLAAAEADVAGFRDQIAGHVSVAAFPSAAAAMLPAAWSALRRDAPHVRIELIELEPEESLPQVLRGELDIAVAHDYDNLPRPLAATFERRALRSDPVVIAVHADHAAANAEITELADFAADTFLAPKLDTSCAEMTVRACATAGFVPQVAARASDFQVLLSLVDAGIGVALVPMLTARRLPDRVRLIHPRLPITRSIFTISRRGGDRKPAVRLVLDALSVSAAAIDSPSAPPR